MNILVIDVGGTHIKIGLSSLSGEKREFESGMDMTPQQMFDGVKALSQDWSYDAVSIGYPGAVLGDKPVHDPANLGAGWVGFDFANALNCPFKLINDAAMQALGNYEGGKMLFLGLGTGLGSTLIVDDIIEPMELAHLPYKKGKTFEDYIGEKSLEKRGKKKWLKAVLDVVECLQIALQPDEVVLGGGNARLLDELPAKTRRGNDLAAFEGGFRLWKDRS